SQARSRDGGACCFVASFSASAFRLIPGFAGASQTSEVRKFPQMRIRKPTFDPVDPRGTPVDVGFSAGSDKLWGAGLAM
ncbi:MAG TPA: hypothetical protein VGA77_10390, partial [Propylenella sp.]